MRLALCLRMTKSFAFAIIAAAFAFSACGSSSSPSSPSPSSPGPGPDVTINITGINGSQSFAPSPTTLKVGQRVMWKNTDTRSHDAAADGGAFTTAVLAAGSTSDPVTMNTPGTFTYHCTIHPSMVGTVTVQ